MRFLPTEHIVYKSPLTADELLKRLAEEVEPPKFRFFPPSNSKIFEGKIEGNAFNINRIIGYRNSFLPRIKGVVGKQIDGTEIEVKMNLHPFVLVFILVFIGFGGLGGISAFFVSLFQGNFSPAMFFPLIFVLFPYALTMGGFKFESVKSKEDLRRLFEAKIISN